MYGQAVEGVDASREPLQEKVSQKQETSGPSEVGSIFGNRVTKSADVYEDGCFHLRWNSSSEKRFFAVRRGCVDGMQLRCPG